MSCTDTSVPMDHELALVMPAYNEEGCIAGVIASWRDMLHTAQIRFIMLVINDGSRDRTPDILQGFADDRRIRVIHQANKGHGPSILRGYTEAVPLAEWVFQCDSDDEMGPASFHELWNLRHGADAVLGCRRNRQQGLQRRLVTAGSRVAVRLLFGPGIRDVNVPYRLIHTRALRPILAHIPADTFAPNVVISGALAIMGARLRNVPVPCVPRKTGCVRIANWALWRAALRSLRQTVQCSRRVRFAELHAAIDPSVSGRQKG